MARTRILTAALGWCALAACAGDDATPATPALTSTVTTTTAPSTTSTTDVTTTATDATTTTVGEQPLFDGDRVLAPGTYRVDKFGVPVHVTVPDGWSTFGGVALLSPAGFEAGYVGFWAVADVNLDACHWHGPARIGPTVDDLAKGLAAQGGVETTDPAPIAVDGRRGQQLQLSVPADLDFAACDDGTVSSWFEAGGASRYYAAPGETETLWIIDIDGARAVVNAGSVGPMTPSTRAEVDAILASIRIG